MKFFFGLLAFIAAIVVVVLLITSLFRSFDSTTETSTVMTTFSLDDPSALQATSTYTISGPVTANENFRQIVISVNKNTRTLTVLKTYSNIVESTQSFANTPEAYSVFIGALDAAAFTDAKIDYPNNVSTTCVTGTKFFYRLTLDGGSKADTWSTSCSANEGSFAGNTGGVMRIFQAQIPNYSQATAGVNVTSM